MGPSIYLGVQGYGCIRAEDKDRFAHRFRQDDSVCCYAVCNKGRYAIQNRLQEGQAYHLTIRQETVTQAVLTRPDAQGVINAVSGNSITVDGMHLPCRAVFEIRTRAGGAVVLPCFLTGRIVGSYHRYSAVLRISGLLRRCIIRRFTVFPVSAPCKTCSEPP